MALEVVDGLRNEDVVMMVTSSEVNNFHYLRARILPGARTWMRMFANVLIVIEDLFVHVKFAIHADDDTYFRPDQILRWLAAIEESGVNTYPIIASPNDNDNNKENVWHIKGCTEIHTNGWYQPMMLNHAALDRLKIASSNYGFAETCTNFAVTHDVGM
eukprot:gene40761-50437_t